MRPARRSGSGPSARRARPTTQEDEEVWFEVRRRSEANNCDDTKDIADVETRQARQKLEEDQAGIAELREQAKACYRDKLCGGAPLPEAEQAVAARVRKLKEDEKVLVYLSRWGEANGCDHTRSIADVQIGLARKMLEERASLVALREQARVSYRDKLCGGSTSPARKARA